MVHIMKKQDGMLGWFETTYNKAGATAFYCTNSTFERGQQLAAVILFEQYLEMHSSQKVCPQGKDRGFIGRLLPS